MEGILLIDKPKGPSSFQIVRKVRALSGVKKVGHAGTLDPLASGLLIVCVGRYTKLADLFADGHKVYQAVVRLGETTTTDDGEGEIVSRCPITHLTEQDIVKAVGQFVGALDQVPPQHSAIKIDGKRAYAMARKAQSVSLKARRITITAIDIEQWALPEITLKIHCSKGTYIRSLARDLGNTLGVGAYAKEIRRLHSGGLSVEQAVSMADLDKSSLKERISGSLAMISSLPCVAVDEYDKCNLMHGRAIKGYIDFNGSTALATHEQNPVAILKKGPSGVEIARVI